MILCPQGRLAVWACPRWGTHAHHAEQNAPPPSTHGITAAAATWMPPHLLTQSLHPPSLTQASSAAATTVPRMFPTDVCAFQMPMISPRLPLPDQLATIETTLGHPVDWNKPAMICIHRGAQQNARVFLHTRQCLGAFEGFWMPDQLAIMLVKLVLGTQQLGLPFVLFVHKCA